MKEKTDSKIKTLLKNEVECRCKQLFLYFSGEKSITVKNETVFFLKVSRAELEQGIFKTNEFGEDNIEKELVDSIQEFRDTEPVGMGVYQVKKKSDGSMRMEFIKKGERIPSSRIYFITCDEFLRFSQYESEEITEFLEDIRNYVIIVYGEQIEDLPTGGAFLAYKVYDVKYGGK